MKDKPNKHVWVSPLDFLEIYILVKLLLVTNILLFMWSQGWHFCKYDVCGCTTIKETCRFVINKKGVPISLALQCSLVSQLFQLGKVEKCKENRWELFYSSTWEIYWPESQVFHLTVYVLINPSSVYIKCIPTFSWNVFKLSNYRNLSSL